MTKRLSSGIIYMIRIKEKDKGLVTPVGKRTIEFSIEKALIKTYQLRKSLSGSRSRAIEVSVPRDFIRGLAWRSGLTYEEFVEQCKVTVFYAGGDELVYKFERVSGDGDGEGD